MKVGDILALLAIALLVSQSLIVSVQSFECTHLPCVQTVDDLVETYNCDNPFGTGESSLFKQFSSLFSIVAVYYDVSPQNNMNSTGPPMKSAYTEDCCNPFDKGNCVLYFLYPNMIFFSIHPVVLKRYSHLSLHVYNEKLSYFDYQRYCWRPPALCNSSVEYKSLLKRFTYYKVSNQENKEGALNLDSMNIQSAEQLKRKDLLKNPRTLVYVVPILIYITTGMCLMKYVSQKRNWITEILVQSSMARCTVRSTMITSWLVGILLFAQYFLTIYHFDKAIDIHLTSRAHKDFFKTQTLIMYIQFGYFIAVLLAEVPCLWMFFCKMNFTTIGSTSNFGKDHIKSGLEHTMTTFGYIGIVLYAQIQSVYAMYLVVYSFVRPFHCLVIATTTMISMFAIIFTLTVIQFYAFRIRRGPCWVHIYNLMTVLSVVTTLLLFLAYIGSLWIEKGPRSNKIFNWDTIVNSVFSFILLGAMGYIFKTLICQKARKEMDTAESDPERQPLVQK